MTIVLTDEDEPEYLKKIYREGFIQRKPMKLFTALKEKNRLAGDIVKLQIVLVRENSRSVKNVSKIDAKTVFESLNEKVVKLAKLKGAIAKANIGIYDKIFEMGELKSQITFLETVPTKEGTFTESIGYGESTQEVEYNAFINDAKKFDLQRDLQDRINVLQDSIDEFNASHEIEI